MAYLSDEDSEDSDGDIRMERTHSNLTEFEVPEPPRKKLKVLTPALLAALDRTGTTDNSATFIIAETLRAMGHNLNDVILSASAITHARKSHRMEFTANLKKDLKVAPHLVVHFDVHFTLVIC